MTGAILITKYWDNCVDCPCGSMDAYSIWCNAKELEVCDKATYYSYKKWDSKEGKLVGEFTALRPKWCPLIEVRGELNEAQFI